MLGWAALGVAATALGGCGAGPSPATPSGRIDVHQHMIPDAYRGWLATRGVVDVGGLPVPEWSESAALASMDRVGTAKALLSVSAPGVTTAANVSEATDMARAVNDAAAELVRDRPDRFGFLATVPLPSVDVAVGEATRALDELGADGLILLATAGTPTSVTPARRTCSPSWTGAAPLSSSIPARCRGQRYPGSRRSRPTSCSTRRGRRTCWSATVSSACTGPSGSS